MGILDEIGDFFGDIVEGVVDFVDDVFNIDLGKVFGNDIVQFALLASSIFTGGVAIANGVMTGFSEIGKQGIAATFKDKFIAGASGFIEGVKQGFLNPVNTFKDLTGVGSGASSATSQVSQALADGGSQAGDIVMGGADGVSPPIAEVGVDVATEVGTSVGIPTDGRIVSDLTQTAGSLGPGGTLEAADAAFLNTATPDFSLAEMARPMNNPANQKAVASAQQALSIDPQQAALESIGATDPGINPMAGIKKAAATTPKSDSFWGKLARGAGEFATSPAGIQMGLGMANGYAQAAMLQKRWDEEREMVRNRARSWSDGTWTPRTWNDTTLQGMKRQNEEMDRINQRGQQAQARWGY